jgi:hypothetical protein
MRRWRDQRFQDSVRHYFFMSPAPELLPLRISHWNDISLTANSIEEMHEAVDTRRESVTAAVVFAQNLSANERVRIATDDLVARDHVRRLNALDRTEAVVRVRRGCYSRTLEEDSIDCSWPHRRPAKWPAWWARRPCRGDRTTPRAASPLSSSIWRRAETTPPTRCRQLRSKPGRQRLPESP